MKFIAPMEPVPRQEVFASEDWLYQVKWDGIRMLAFLERGQVELFNRKQRRRTLWYPELTDEVAGLACTSAVLDGEVIVLHEGRPDFFRVLKRELLSDPNRLPSILGRIPVQYTVFDLLSLDGRNLMKEPLTHRLETLTRLLPPASSVLHLCDSFDDGPGLWEATRQQQLEGIVMKERKSPYHSGQKHPSWQKVKHFQTLTATAVGVFTRGSLVQSILLGLEGEDGWTYIGRAGSGLSERERRLLTEAVPGLKRGSPVVLNPPSARLPTIWLEPVLRVEVRYLEWTPQGTLRSPTVIGFRLPGS
ncbi:hypothetical protein ACFQ49_00555 [Kroppenstedtia eburnea]|uniref:DNA ligase (ATP) n=1 Tax=Kroppenstedtia eburnea TaxID=714067 RepID=A0A1N7IQT5_9BACL|nr:hypothetical protein [Kroppenstedtia eburnea]QKI82097.1 hypothetical protein GXN75_08825 [Kroppenstedtia eburnea]SIS39417.1 bifunctional non-homologous end joining protein LigD [Kroppenstedtia eburnea]